MRLFNEKGLDFSQPLKPEAPGQHEFFGLTLRPWLPDSCDERPRMISSSLASAPLVRQNYHVRSSHPEVTVSIIKLGFWCLFLTIAQPTLLLAKDRPAARTEADAKLPAAITALSARIDALGQSQNAELKAADSKLTAAEASLSARIDGILQTQETKIKALEAKVPTIPWWGNMVLAAVLGALSGFGSSWLLVRQSRQRFSLNTSGSTTRERKPQPRA
jgi:hypothetical protein